MSEETNHSLATYTSRLYAAVNSMRSMLFQKLSAYKHISNLHLTSTHLLLNSSNRISSYSGIKKCM